MCAARMLQKLLEKYNRSSPRLTGAGGLSPELADRVHSTAASIQSQQSYQHNSQIFGLYEECFREEIELQLSEGLRIKGPIL